MFKWIQSKENGKNEDIASQINETLSQHHFKVKFLGEEDDDGYKGISDGKVNQLLNAAHFKNCSFYHQCLL